MRTVIVGGPRTGKTTRSYEEWKKCPGAQGIIHTDGWENAGDFSTQSAAAAAALGKPEPFTMEGVTAVRALRKWMRDHPGKPCDKVVRLTEPKVALSEGQRRLGVGCDTVFREIEPELRRRGVVIE